MSKLSAMQGTPAFLEYLKPKEYHRRNKKKCINYKGGICMSKTARFMTKCTSPTFCNQYKKMTESNKINNNLNRKSKMKIETKPENKTIKLYSKVKIKDYSMDEIFKITIVPKNESDPINSKISVESELSKALLGKKKDDIIKVNFKEGKKQGYCKYKVLEFK